MSTARCCELMEVYLAEHTDARWGPAAPAVITHTRTACGHME